MQNLGEEEIVLKIKPKSVLEWRGEDKRSEIPVSRAVLVLQSQSTAAFSS